MNIESPEEVARIKAELWNDDADIEFNKASPHERLVAEGDSWFDYLPGIDILDHLKWVYNYKIKKYGNGGDTLENMVYGTEFRRNWVRRTPQIEETLRAIRQYSPKVFLFSGGGNDFAGPELDAFFNHADAKIPTFLREDYLQYMIFTVFKKAYEDLIAKVTAISPSIQIISHGYGYAIPDGRAVVNFLRYRFIGPWLRPTFTRKNILDIKERTRLIATIIDRFNEMLAQLDGVHGVHKNFHYLDLRPYIQEKDWVNELHLYNDSYKRIAGRFDEEIKKYMI